MAKIQGKQINLDTNPSLGTSDKIVSSQKAIKQYVDTQVAASSAIIYTATIPAMSSSPYVINHELNSFNYFVNVYDDLTKADIVVDIDRIDANNVEISYSPINDNALIVLIFSTNIVANLGTSGNSSPDYKNSVDLEIFTAATYNATQDTHYLHYNGSGAATVYLPSIPRTNQQIVVSDITGNGGTNNITIDGNGYNINGSSTAVINTNYGSIMFIFNGVNWAGLAFIS